jgi:hypothetical protein
MQFNPYVQQLPVEAMAQVGMYKQQKYEEGVQKIQSYIDKVAGMDIERDVDKQYLQSKLNQLGSKLKTVAAGDFSNFQLVNSVGGMATQIVRDPFVSAAVSSTANDRKNQARMMEDEKSNKLTPHARYNYELKRNAYLNNKNLTNEEGKPIQFVGQYTQSWDIDKNMMEAIDAVGEGKWTASQIFKTDPSTGAILYNVQKVKDPKTGKIVEVNGGPILSEYAVKEIREGKFSENIKSAIDLVLSRPEAQQELSMRGVYTYRGYDNINDFVQQYESERANGINILESRKLEILAKATEETDPERKKALQQLADKAEDEIKTLSENQDPRVKQALESRDLDSYKALVYTQGFKNQYAKAYTTETLSRDYVENVAYTAQQKKIEAERDFWKDQQTVAQGWKGLDLRGQELAASIAKTEFEKEKWKYDPTNPDNNINQAKPYEGGAAAGDLYSNWINQGAELTSSYDSGKKQFVVDYMKALNYANGRNSTDEEIIRTAEKYEKSAPGFFERQFANAKAAVQKNPQNVAYANLVSALPGLTNLEKKVDKYSREIDDVNNDFEVTQALGGKKFVDLEKTFKPAKIKGVGTFDNREITLSAKDQMNLARVLGTPSGSPENKRAELELRSATGLPSNQIIQMIGQIAETGKSFKEGGFTSFLTDPLYSFDRRTPEHKAAAGNIKKYWDALSTNVINAKEAVLKRKMKGASPLAYELYPTGAKETDRKSVDDRLRTVLGDKANAQDLSAFEAFYSGSSGDQGKYTVNIGVDRGGASGGTSTLTLDLYDGTGKLRSVAINKNDADYITGRNLKLPSEVSDVVEKLQWSESKQSTNSVTSDPNKPDAYTGAYYKSSDFYSLQRPNIMGADIKINNLGQANVYFYNKEADGSVKPVPVKMSPFDILPAPFTSADAAEAFIKGLKRPSDYDNILKNVRTTK